MPISVFVRVFYVYSNVSHILRHWFKSIQLQNVWNFPNCRKIINKEWQVSSKMWFLRAHRIFKGSICKARRATIGFWVQTITWQPSVFRKNRSKGKIKSLKIPITIKVLSNNSLHFHYLYIKIITSLIFLKVIHKQILSIFSLVTLINRILLTTMETSLVSTRW